MTRASNTVELVRTMRETIVYENDMNQKKIKKDLNEVECPYMSLYYYYYFYFCPYIIIVCPDFALLEMKKNRIRQ